MIKTICSLLVLINLLQADFLRDDTNDIVLDTSTNLMWQDDTTPATMTWEDAISYCENTVSLGGYSDWRLPNFNELYNLADRSKYNPALSNVFQNIVSSRYWSSTTVASGTSYAWVVSFYYGYGDAYDKTYTFYVRCVRATDN